MSAPERFLIQYDDHAITLQLDRALLTEEKATQINQFWGGAESRLDAEDGDVIRAVVRLFGAAAIRCMLSEGGASFSASDTGAARWWLEKVLDDQAEGWYGAEELGVAIVTADVFVPDFDVIRMETVPHES